LLGVGFAGGPVRAHYVASAELSVNRGHDLHLAETMLETPGLHLCIPKRLYAGAPVERAEYSTRTGRMRNGASLTKAASADTDSLPLSLEP
jgi:hypothetical protein